VTRREDSIAGAILGTAVGDALGLPREGLSRRRAERLFGSELRHRFIFGRGMVSDDTEHTCFVGQALLKAPDDSDAFARALAWQLRLWLLGLPAGIGSATLRATLRLWLGFPPGRSGVWSAGAGPAMRAPLLGVCIGGDAERLHDFVRASSLLTHRDPRAEEAAMLIALAAHHGSMHGPEGVDASGFLDAAMDALAGRDEELSKILSVLGRHLAAGSGADEPAAELGLELGVGGYAYHVAPMAVFCWLRWPDDFRRALTELILLGGDTDTTGAVLGGIAGATVGASGIPAEWIDGLFEWPRSVGWMRRLAERLADGLPTDGAATQRQAPLRTFWPGLLPRNLLFLTTVLLHGFRRLLPPYG